MKKIVLFDSNLEFIFRPIKFFLTISLSAVWLKAYYHSSNADAPWA